VWEAGILLGVLAHAILQCIFDSLALDFDHNDGILEGKAIDNVLQSQLARREDLVCVERPAVDERTIGVLMQTHEVSEEIAEVRFLGLRLFLSCLERYGCLTDGEFELLVNVLFSLLLQLLHGFVLGDVAVQVAPRDVEVPAYVTVQAVGFDVREVLEVVARAHKMNAVVELVVLDPVIVASEDEIDCALRQILAEVVVSFLSGVRQDNDDIGAIVTQLRCKLKRNISHFAKVEIRWQ